MKNPIKNKTYTHSEDIYVDVDVADVLDSLTLKELRDYITFREIEAYASDRKISALDGHTGASLYDSVMNVLDSLPLQAYDIVKEWIVRESRYKASP